MYELFPCIPISGGFFLLKHVKKCLYVIMLKIALVLVKIYVLVGKKGIREFGVLDRPITQCSYNSSKREI